jgi:molybdate-binding protein
MDELNPGNDAATRSSREGPADESVALEHAAQRISEKFPDVPREDIDRLVEEHSEEYDGAAIRDFVPVLVEHEVKAELRESGA